MMQPFTCSHGSKSSLHYDQHHNLLCVVAGSKVVNLFSPLATCLLAPKPVWSESANHSQIDFANPDLRRFPRYQTAQKYRRRAELQVRCEEGAKLCWHPEPPNLTG